MTGYQLLLVAHIGSVVLFVGPTASAASRFPGALRRGLEVGHLDVAVEHDRVVRTYGTGAIAVPVLGLALAQQGGWLEAGAIWVYVSLGITLAAGAAFVGAVLPAQRAALERADAGDVAVAGALIRRLHGLVGAINLGWAAVLVIMVVKPW